MLKDEILDRVNRKYRTLKMAKNPCMAPELLPSEVGSDQIKAVIEVFSELLEKSTEKKRKIIHIDYENEEDVIFAKKFMELYNKMNEENE